MKRLLFASLALLVAVSMVLTACAPKATPTPTPKPAPTKAPEATKPPAVEKPYAGETVTIFGAAQEEQVNKFEASMVPFEERTGIEVVYEGSADFETIALVRSEAGDPYDIYNFPQPGLMADFARSGFLTDLGQFLDDAYLKTKYTQSWLDLGTVDGELVGVWHNADVKSLVWYPVAEFEAAGYTVPETWDELLALMDKMVADGNVPWCIGIESGGATGWPGTDWIEDIMLRTTSPENYDRWTRGELKFDSPEVRNAFDVLGNIWFNKDYVYGGTTSILQTFFGDGPTPLFDDPPSCFMHRQASFIVNFFPEGTKVGPDGEVNYFYLPPIDAAYGKPVLGSGSIMSMGKDTPAVRLVMEYLTTGESTKAEVEAGILVSPHKDASLDWYPDATTRGFAEILMAADTFRFDGSDLMPGAVGAGSFWTGIVDYVGGEDLNAVLKDIDASWPGAPAAEKPYAGETVTIFGAAQEEQVNKFEASMVPFEERTGIEVVYEGSADFETIALVRSEAGDPYDIYNFPQPGLMADFARSGFLTDLGQFLDDAYLKTKYTQSWLDLGTVDGELVGVWHNADVKSLVWYPVAEFEAAGYTVPETWDELLALMDKMVADGNVPWCIGIESGGATGWPGTDWIEDIMLRTTSPENYDRWTRGELKFDSPEVRNAFDVLGNIWFNKDYVYGGTTSILQTFFGDGPTPLFDDPPSCFMHRQASFIVNFFPEGTKVGPDGEVNYFYLPPIDAAYGKPVLGSGSIMSMGKDTPAVRLVMEYLTTGESTKAEVEAGILVSPHKDASLDWYPDATTRGFAEILMAADTFRFDGSDLMPGAVGAGSFWTGIVDYVGGEDLDAVLKDIDASWPE